VAEPETGMLMRKALCLGAAFTVALCAGSPEGQTAEYGFTTYPLGGLAFGAGITPPPGVYVTDVTSFYDGTIGGNFNFGGRTFDAGVRAQIFSGETNILYVPEVKVFDGLIGFSLSVPTAYVDYTAKTTGPLGNIVTAHTDGTGLGDFVYQFQIGWDKPDFSHTFYALFVAPTGRYSTGFYPLAGLNRPSFDIGWSFTYFDKDSKIQLNGAIGFMASTENEATQYQTGNEVHFEWAIGYKFTDVLIAGVVGYDYRQVTGDSGKGAILGPFESAADAIGPGLSYTTKFDETPITINIRDYEQYNTKHFFQGNTAVASVTAAFAAAQPLK
jgi:hypothetical protein